MGPGNQTADIADDVSSSSGKASLAMMILILVIIGYRSRKESIRNRDLPLYNHYGFWDVLLVLSCTVLATSAIIENLK